MPETNAFQDAILNIRIIPLKEIPCQQTGKLIAWSQWRTEEAQPTVCTFLKNVTTMPYEVRMEIRRAFDSYQRNYQGEAITLAREQSELIGEINFK